MSFSCQNYEFDTDKCRKLKSDCIPGRPGCVLEGRVALSEELERRIQELADAAAQRKKERNRS